MDKKLIFFNQFSELLFMPNLMFHVSSTSIFVFYYAINKFLLRRGLNEVETQDLLCVRAEKKKLLNDLEYKLCNL